MKLGKLILFLLIIPFTALFARGAGDYRGGERMDPNFNRNNPAADRAVDERAIEDRDINKAIESGAGAVPVPSYGNQYVPVPVAVPVTTPAQPQTTPQK